MSSARLFNRRQGDRSEYLAQYLLSGLGLATPVPRQEDVGLDFHCSLADQELGLLTFGFPFAIQIKSASSPDFSLGGMKDGKWLDREIDWFWRQTTPLFLGVVDKKRLTLDIYSTSAVRLAWANAKGRKPTELVLRPRATGDPADHVSYPETSPAENAQADMGDGLTHTVDLGPALVSIDPAILDDRDRLAKAKQVMRTCVSCEQENILHGLLGVPYFTWFLTGTTNETCRHAWMHVCIPVKSVTDQIQRILAQPLISLARGLLNQGRVEEAGKLAGVFELVPDDAIPAEVRPELKSILESHR